MSVQLSSSNPMAYASSLAAQLVELAVFANQPMNSSMLPGNWQLNYQGSVSADYGASQYFFASKTFTSGSDSVKVCALVLGAQWSPFLSYYLPSINQSLQPLPGVIAGGHVTNNANVTLGFEQLYAVIRQNMLKDLQKVKDNIPGYSSSMPVITVGLGPGAPLAQMAAMDIRPGKEPVQGESDSPVTELASYIYSGPAFGDDDWKSLFGTLVPNGYRVEATGDLFPTAPGSSEGFYQAGVSQQLGVYIPGYDSPWFERDGNYYAALLKHKSIADTTKDSGSTTGAPSGFDSALAFTLGKLLAVVYQQYQHPGTAPSFNFKPYDVVDYYGDNDDAWVGLYDGPSYLVVAARGAVTWQETMNNISASAAGVIPWVPEDSDVDYGQYSQPLIDIYNSIRCSLRDALNSARNKPVLITGHSDGGSLANLSALDLQINPLAGKRTVNAIYTFGALPAATPSFSTAYDKLFANNNYQIVRPTDVLPKIEFQFPMFSVGTRVNLDGGAFNPGNGSTNHALSTYLDLLDPGQ